MSALERLKGALAGHYRIEHELGAAIKVLRRWPAASYGNVIRQKTRDPGDANACVSRTS